MAASQPPSRGPPVHGKTNFCTASYRVDPMYGALLKNANALQDSGEYRKQRELTRIHEERVQWDDLQCGRRIRGIWCESVEPNIRPAVGVAVRSRDMCDQALRCSAAQIEPLHPIRWPQ